MNTLLRTANRRKLVYICMYWERKFSAYDEQRESSLNRKAEESLSEELRSIRQNYSFRRSFFFLFFFVVEDEKEKKKEKKVKSSEISRSTSRNKAGQLHCVSKDRTSTASRSLK